LVLTRAQLAQEVADHQARLARVEQRLRYIELEDDMSLDMVIKQIPEVRVAQVRYRGDEGLDFYSVRAFAEPAMETLGAALDAAKLTRTATGFMYYELRDDGSLTPIIAVPIGDQPFDGTDEVEVGLLPAFDAVVTIYRGAPNHDEIGPLYGQMARYAEDHGYGTRGPGRDHLIEQEGDEVVIELVLPVERITT
jgi:effector-binding domain-containing protein